VSDDDHRVLSHLGLRAQEYDAAIRTYIPAYETMLATIVDLVGDDRYVIDLGTGTGALAAQILDHTARARVRLVDIDPEMLEVARGRVARHGSRAEPVQARFTDALVPCDAVIATLALHHVMDIDAKRDLYRRIHAALRPGGILAIGDATVHPDGPEHDTIYKLWAAEMGTHGIDAAEAQRLFAAWAQEDRYLPLAMELQLLADAGFARPDCFWKHGPMTVFGGYR
jgi:tRNA (cmo5U34)-methyltransferase